MAFEEHQQRKYRVGNPYADYEYVGKGSRQPWRGLIFTFLFGLVLFWLAWMRWRDISAAEQSGSDVYMTTLEWGLYKISGKWGTTAFFGLTGAALVWFGIRNYNRLEKMKRS